MLVAVGLVAVVPAVVVAVADPELRHAQLVVALVLGAGAALEDEICNHHCHQTNFNLPQLLTAPSWVRHVPFC